jgi:hypothetical protein
MIKRALRLTSERYERLESPENRKTPVVMATAVDPKSFTQAQNAHEAFRPHTNERAKHKREHRRHTNLRLKRRLRERG